MKRIIVSILILTAVFAIQGLTCSGSFAADSNGPFFGKWAFSGRDAKGVAWTGTITISELDTKRFDTNKYYSACVLDAASKDSGRGVDSPCRWNPDTREVAFGTGLSMYTATLSADRKGMMQGKWTESDKDFHTRKITVTSTGVWSAKYTGQ